MLDAMDHQILRALQCSARAPFARIADVLGVSEQTVSRRYGALRRGGVVRVLGRVPPTAYRRSEWIARIRCRPDRTVALADNLVRRPEVSFAHLASAGTEIICHVSAADDAVLLRELPKAQAVLTLDVDLLLHRFGSPFASQWTGYGHGLTADQIRALSDAGAAPVGPAVEPTEQDVPLLAALAEDGRADYARLVAVTGWSKGKLMRRMQLLESAGSLFYDVDVLPEKLGYPLHATLWLRLAPHALELVGEQLIEHEQIAFAGATSGAHNIMAVAVCRDSAHLYRYLTSKIAQITAIDGYEVSVRVRRLKQAGSVVTGGRLVPAAVYERR